MGDEQSIEGLLQKSIVLDAGGAVCVSGDRADGTVRLYVEVTSRPGVKDTETGGFIPPIDGNPGGMFWLALAPSDALCLVNHIKSGSGLRRIGGLRLESWANHGSGRCQIVFETQAPGMDGNGATARITLLPTIDERTELVQAIHECRAWVN